MAANMNLTDRQAVALKAAVEKGGAWYARVNKTGGAWARLCHGLADRGLLSDVGPYAATDAGRTALAAYDEAKLEKAYRRGEFWAVEVMLKRKAAA